MKRRPGSVTCVRTMVGEPPSWGIYIELELQNVLFVTKRRAQTLAAPFLDVPIREWVQVV